MGKNKKTWKQFHDNAITHSGAHYLMAIYECVEKQGYARLSDVAQKLDTSMGSLSTSLKPLIKKGLINQDNNKHLTLTDEGKALAIQSKNTYAAMKHLLHNILGVDEKVAEIDACKIEHLLSEKSTISLLNLIKILQKHRGLLQKEIAEAVTQFDVHSFPDCPIPSHHIE
jgi:DtxR family transcriptional regulator, Mn-dependent transcriptional regulator